MLTLTLNQHSNLTQNQLSNPKSCSHCQPTRGRLKIHTRTQRASTTLAMKYQTS